MSLTKVNYIDNSTIITAKNLNDIQDNIIQNAEDLNNIQNNIIELNNNSISKDNIINNFTTTEEGFVADARALKVLNDMISGIGFRVIDATTPADTTETVVYEDSTLIDNYIAIGCAVYYYSCWRVWYNDTINQIVVGPTGIKMQLGDVQIANCPAKVILMKI